MKSLNTLSILFISFLFLSVSSVAQQIDSIQVTPSYNPLPTDTVKVYIHQTFPSGGCAGTANFTKSTFNIGSSSLHCLGALAVICHDIDTLIIPPPHTAGTYRIIHVLSTGFGGPPCSPGIVPSDIDTAYYTVGPITPPNNPPMIAPIPGDSICDTATYTNSFTIADEDVANVTISAYSDNQLVVSDANITLGGTGANRTITVTPTPGNTGLANIFVVAEDVKNQKDSISFPIFTVNCDTFQTGMEIERSLLINAFPNPGGNEIHLIHLPDISIAQLQMIDISGRRFQVPFERSGSSVSVNVTVLPEGVYILRLVDVLGHESRTQVIVER